MQNSQGEADIITTAPMTRVHAAAIAENEIVVEREELATFSGLQHSFLLSKRSDILLCSVLEEKEMLQTSWHPMNLKKWRTYAFLSLSGVFRFHVLCSSDSGGMGATLMQWALFSYWVHYSTCVYFLFHELHFSQRFANCNKKVTSPLAYRVASQIEYFLPPCVTPNSMTVLLSLTICRGSSYACYLCRVLNWTL